MLQGRFSLPYSLSHAKEKKCQYIFILSPSLNQPQKRVETQVEKVLLNLNVDSNVQLLVPYAKRDMAKMAFSL